MSRVFWTFAVLGLVVGGLLVAPGAAGAQGPPQTGWAQLGNLGTVPIRAVRVSPDWPRERLILALREKRLIRSRDGGEQWELVGPPGELSSLELLPSTGSGPVAFANSTSTDTQTLYRSTSAGDSWQPVLVLADLRDGSLDQPPLLTASPAFGRDQVVILDWGRHLYQSADAGASWTQLPISGRLQFSPTFGQDGFALVISEGTALATQDGGLTWNDAGIAPDQWLQDVRFSPTFATDRTIFATARADPSTDDSASSYGVLISTDAGATWRPSSDGLAVDGVPYLSTGSLLISPTYAQDHTLFVTAFGPVRDKTDTDLQAWPWGVFESLDGASSWQAVSTDDGYPDRSPRTSLALSPAFAQDKLMVSTHVVGLLAQRPSGCTIERSHDGGATWARVDPRFSDLYWSCGGAVLLGVPGQVVVSLGIFGLGASGSAVWVEQPAGPEWFRSPIDITAAPVAAADGTVFLGTRSGGIFAHGPSAVSTMGSLAPGGIP